MLAASTLPLLCNSLVTNAELTSGSPLRNAARRTAGPAASTTGRVARRAALALATLAVAAGVARYAVPKVYYRERHRLVARLEQIPGTRVTDVHEHNPGSGWTSTPAYATVQVGGRTGAALALGRGPTADSLWDAGGVVLYEIGPYSFLFERDTGPYGTQDWNYLDLSAGSEFGGFVGGFEARTPDDVIRNYDLLVTAVGRLPRAGTFTGRSGTVYRYRIE